MAKEDCEGHKRNVTRRKANLNLELVVSALSDPRIWL